VRINLFCIITSLRNVHVDKNTNHFKRRSPYKWTCLQS